MNYEQFKLFFSENKNYWPNLYRLNLNFKNTKLKQKEIFLYDLKESSNDRNKNDVELIFKYKSTNEFVDESNNLNEALLKNKWRWDVYNISSLTLTLSFFLFQFYCFFWNWLINNVLIFFKKSTFEDELIRFSLKSMSQNIHNSNFYCKINNNFIEVLIDVSLNFDILF